MKYLLLLSLLTGCNMATPALVDITCYDKNGNITHVLREFRGEWQLMDDPTKSYRSEKCIVERINK